MQILPNTTELRAEKQLPPAKTIGGLEKWVQDSVQELDRLKFLNRRLGIGLGLLGILLGLGATVSGLFDEAKVAAIFGACASTTQAILFAYPVDKRAAAYRILAARTRNLLIDLELRDNAPEQLQQLVEELKTIRLEAAAEEGKAMSLEETIAQLKALLAEQDAQEKNKQ